MRSAFLIEGFLAFSGFLTVSSLYAGEVPTVEFSADYVVACRDVTPKEFTQENKNKKLIEVVLRVSVNLKNGKEADLDDVIFALFDKKETKKLYVSDYIPKTELKSDITDPIVVVEWAGSGSVRYMLTDANGFAKGVYQASKVEYKKLPPLKLLLASGITERGYGVFYKLKPSDQATLEGDRTFSCIFAVPRTWRGDCLHVRCEANGFNRGIIRTFDKKVQSGLAGFVVALHMEGDDEAEKLAKQVVDQQQKYFDEIILAQKESKTEKDWFQTVWDWIAFLQGLSPGATAMAFNAKFMMEKDTKPELKEALSNTVAEEFNALEKAIKKLEAISGD